MGVAPTDDQVSALVDEVIALRAENHELRNAIGRARRPQWEFMRALIRKLATERVVASALAEKLAEVAGRA